jgi:hypothetical protein
MLLMIMVPTAREIPKWMKKKVKKGTLLIISVGLNCSFLLLNLRYVTWVLPL